MPNTRMRVLFSIVISTMLILTGSSTLWAQDNPAGTVPALNHRLDASQQRPIPYPVITPSSFKRALDRQERDVSGRPGAKYWTNYAHYDIDATLSPSSRMLRGSETITYINRSPDSLNVLMVHLRQNFYKKGEIRNRSTRLTGGMHLTEVKLDGKPLIEYNRAGRTSGYSIDGTLMDIRPARKIAPGDTARLSMEWSFKVPPEDGYRMGQDGEVFYLGYWYPQMAVYDDISGWKAQPYMGDGEFYMGYADYSVSITLPQGWLVNSTGELQNAEEVLTPAVRQRLKRAAQSDSTITIVGEKERKAGTSTQTDPAGMLTWKYRAEQVRDVAFGTSPHYVWDATSARVNSGRRCLINALYRPEHKYWDRAAEFAKYTIEDLSRQLMPYPWPHMSVLEGVIGGGMEYPMMTLIGSYGDYPGVFGTIYHETAHMWFPMIVGSNEKAHAWMDEGLVTYLTNQGEAKFWNRRVWMPGQSYYYFLAGTNEEVPIMRHADLFPPQGPSRIMASYSKPGLLLHTLEGILGEQTFGTAMQQYVSRWKYKHPTPYDFFNTFEDVAGEDLDWFWTPGFFETWTLDQEIEQVEQTAQGVEVTIRDLGLFPMPVLLKATYADGSTVEKQLPVDVWLRGKRSTQITLKSGEVQKVQIDPNFYTPDINFANNIWQSGDSSNNTQ